MPVRVSIVTVVRDGAAHIEAALRSVLDQNYPDLEYIVLDGGSLDGTANIVRRYESRLAFFRTGPDGGQYAALTEGFARATGDVLGWLNADDLHMPWSLATLARLFADLPDMDWVTSRVPVVFRADGLPILADEIPGIGPAQFRAGAAVPGAPWRRAHGVQQESTFFRRRLWEKAGGFDPACGLAGDFALWCRFAARAELHYVNVPLAGFRRHSGNRSADAARYEAEALAAYRTMGWKPWSPARAALAVPATRALRALNAPVLRRAAAMMGLYEAAPIVRYDEAAARWRVSRE
ncbi:MAG: glycosyltransferase [Tagaea sp.]|nr:glycosyltransferase [Tagaea sp.]